MRADVARRHFLSLHGQQIAYLAQAEGVANLILDFMATPEPARITTAQMRDVMRAHRPRRRQAS